LPFFDDRKGEREGEKAAEKAACNELIYLGTEKESCIRNFKIFLPFFQN
jgi:hypothetical protein